MPEERIIYFSTKGKEECTEVPEGIPEAEVREFFK